MLFVAPVNTFVNYPSVLRVALVNYRSVFFVAPVNTFVNFPSVFCVALVNYPSVLFVALVNPLVNFPSVFVLLWLITDLSQASWRQHRSSCQSLAETTCQKDFLRIVLIIS